MATIKLSGYRVAAGTSVLSTELNSLANGSTSAVSGSPYDNTTNLSLYADFELQVTFGVAPTVGDTVDLYMATSLDGTNYEVMPAAGTTTPQSWKRIGSFALETTATTQRIHIWRVPLAPGKMQFQVTNNSGTAFPASGSTVKLYDYNLTVA